MYLCLLTASLPPPYGQFVNLYYIYTVVRIKSLELQYVQEVQFCFSYIRYKNEDFLNIECISGSQSHSFRVRSYRLYDSDLSDKNQGQRDEAIDK